MTAFSLSRSDSALPERTSLLLSPGGANLLRRGRLLEKQKEQAMND